MKKLIKYNNREEVNLLKDIKKKFSENNFKGLSGSNENNVIFILGLPRSGTSLVEQIVSSHKKVFGGGELPILPHLIKKNLLNKENHFKDNFSEIIKDTKTLEIFKKDYLKFIKNFNYSEKYITDKAPLNFRWIGIINLIFPKSKIIHCLRDPKDNCLSMFKNLFEGGLNFTYSQEDLVEYFNHYQELMNFWKLHNSDMILDIKYENLISNNEDEIKKDYQILWIRMG